ncbi:hypothetical protein HanXRQr2_Chr10g0454291 [Helianthus annuus]|uniref:Uncharacterized protein n=1 Tax=Helianthus annuus TaxID=4232 RepID=A0A9K3HZI0_HELAN|nr:hypothetical protein HanXRQr2_Chr10g0454291 [Helianthus annuus]KAJ0884839.1 hypothetical protein HanPSC8_Chr10g0438511 [Helianthus annuus]
MTNSVNRKTFTTFNCTFKGANTRSVHLEEDDLLLKLLRLLSAVGS